LLLRGKAIARENFTELFQLTVVLLLVVGSRVQKDLDHLGRKRRDVATFRLELLEVLDHQDVLHDEFQDFHRRPFVCGRGVLDVLDHELQSDVEGAGVIEEEPCLWELLLALPNGVSRDPVHELHVDGIVRAGIERD